MPSVAELKTRLAQTLKAKKLDAALVALTELAREEPKVAMWPRREAKLQRLRQDPEGELAALRRALELQVDQGLVLDAIASCKVILELAPDDDATLDTLDLLYVSGSGSDGVSPLSFAKAYATGPVEARDEHGQTMNAALDSLLLTDVVPEAHAVQFADAQPGHINEIPIDSLPSGDADGDALALDDDVLDLKLEEVSSDPSRADLAAARAVSLPAGAAGKRASRPLPSSERRGESLRRELASIPLFGDLDPASLHDLIRKVRVVSLSAGEMLFRQGDEANSLYVIFSGAVVPIAEGERRRKLAVLERGAFFGEIGLLTKQPRNATIEALVETRLLAIDRRLVWGLIKKEPSVAKSILRFLRARMIDRQIRTNLFFSAFAHAERESVARQFRILEVKDGTRIVEQGKPAEGLFVVLAGSLETTQREGGVTKSAGALGLGDVFGGLSLLEGAGSKVSVIAQGKCWLVVLGESRFRRILDANPCLVLVLERLSNEAALGSRSARARSRALRSIGGDNAARGAAAAGVASVIDAAEFSDSDLL